MLKNQTTTKWYSQHRLTPRKQNTLTLHCSCWPVRSWPRLGKWLRCCLVRGLLELLSFVEDVKVSRRRRQDGAVGSFRFAIHVAFFLYVRAPRRRNDASPSTSVVDGTQKSKRFAPDHGIRDHNFLRSPLKTIFQSSVHFQIGRTSSSCCLPSERP